MKRFNKFFNFQDGKVKLLILMIATIACIDVFGTRIARSQNLVAPPPPDVPPLIAETYSNDKDGNHIEDLLEFDSRKLLFSISNMDKQEQNIDVQLVFNAPITQYQIDEFLRIGGIHLSGIV